MPLRSMKNMSYHFSVIPAESMQIKLISPPDGAYREDCDHRRSRHCVTFVVISHLLIIGRSRSPNQCLSNRKRATGKIGV